ncbi:cytochrome P450 2C23-like isoform X1 [Lacerta agilis]|uniref:cytochrome P450 2C23-like isoform X1 n=1 Tax=Lacerta agilis TaxID=80427 RepID=UPI00141A13B7|nr:cytochrome P450 2C23-like isoform X1 [Lacerta agilis]
METPALSSLSLLLLFCLLIVQFVKLQWRKRQFPPGPTPLPVIGCLWQLKFFNVTRESLTKVAKSYGDIYTVWFGPHPVVVLDGFKAVKDGLTTHPEDVVGRPVVPFFKALANNKGILLSTGSTWKHQRKFSLMTLKTLGLGKRTLEYQIQDEAYHLVENFRSTRGKPMNPSFALTLAVSNVICVVVFGHRFSTEDKKFHELLEAMEVIFKFAGSLGHNIYNVMPWLMKCIPGPHKKALTARDFVCSFIRKEISKHQIAGVPDDPQDFIYSYLAQIEKTKDQPKPAYDESNMIQCIFDLFLGGTETSSTTLYWGFLYMVLYPDIQANIQKEIDAVVAPGQMISGDDRKKLPYTNAVIHEVQRFSNIISVGLPRLCVKDTMIRQFTIKRGTMIFPNMASALYDPNEWATPESFNPNHFLDKDGNFVCPEAFIPFSLGQRVCLGDHLAKTEMFLFFSNLLQAFTFHLAEGTKDVNTEPILGGTLQPHYFEICAIPR